jgi:cystathionine gamma-synthase
VVDGTMTTPILQRPLTLGADLVVHSATKYLGGHADATAGIVVARASLLRDTLRRYSKLLGAVLGPFEAQLIARGIKTLALRVRQQCANAAAIATWLAEQPQIDRVYYPGLPSHPQHDLAARVFGDLFGAMVSFDLRNPDGWKGSGGREALFRLVDGLRLILPATSLGDIYTLVSLPVISSHRDLTPEQRAERGIGDSMVRLSIGIEEVEDLIADLRAALNGLQV